MFASTPWWRNVTQNVQNAVESVVQDATRAAEELTGQHRRNRNDRARRTDRTPQQEHFPFPFHNETFDAEFMEAQTYERTPPASARAIRQLPTIIVKPEDLVDENNRDCCICMESNNLGEKVCRLPCAHIFHEACITDWLRNRKCTCPICRYELPTDNPRFEEGRAERMKHRRPRYARYELERMSIPELLALNRSRAAVVGEKNDLIQFLIDNQCIDLIPAPPAVEYAMEDLRSMKISQLKRAMAEAGVFFNASDVVEKSDMIDIFVCSGRLNVVPSKDNGTVEPSTHDGYKGKQTSVSTPQQPPSEEAQKQTLGPSVETVQEDSDAEEEPSNQKTEISSPEIMFPNARNDDPSLVGNIHRRTDLGVSGNSEQTTIELESNDTDLSHNIGSSQIPEINSGARTPNGDRQTPSPLNETATGGSTPQLDSGGNGTASPMAMEIDDVWPPDSAGSMEIDEGITEDLAHHVGTEATAAAADWRARNSEESRTSDQDQLQRLIFTGWSVSQLRAIASEVNIDLSHCTTRSEMVDRILQDANVVRPYLRDYLRVLAPLAQSNLSGLRATARQFNVDISDCLEKEEIIQRLITRSKDFGFF